LLWVGTSHYKTPRKFTHEAARLGISKRLPHVPRGFLINKTRIFLAHAQAAWDPELFQPTPGIFATFVPTAIEYVVSNHDDTGKLENLQTKGVSLVTIDRIDPEPDLPGITP
jgi:hypothetical protein